MHLFIPQGDFSPAIYWDYTIIRLDIRGESTMENPQDFYAHLIDLLQPSLAANPCKKLELNLDLSYLNTGSQKSLYELFEFFIDQGLDAYINWWVDDAEDDYELQAIGDYTCDFPAFRVRVLQRA
ncbi:DUF1987 domain-containing protein [Microscilla marina]|uniref:SiaC family regulatory phosphoprotein domain-containing protein n=1 Tax=Microscilla marina ATCC 23134 TaxID=313606 RepID=A1ZUN1_MICM2|nr:DUF1987 domain-containing protein [Microscilla marina]EAY25917.1 conserved hypothetical protein [Microscilla marina ATCC 23134]